ncbi:unnamed protein product [Scytosiphon promiscuus]
MSSKVEGPVVTAERKGGAIKALTLSLLPMLVLLCGFLNGFSTANAHHAAIRGHAATRGTRRALRLPEQANEITVSEESLNEIMNTVVLQQEGLIYCAIAKTGCAEWKRALRWMVGMENWDADDSVIHRWGHNGLEELKSWGLAGTQWALRSDRYFRFVVVRDPAERVLSAFLNKCVVAGISRDDPSMLQATGVPNCPYLEWMPDMFNTTTGASLATNKVFRDALQADPEGTFFKFISGVLAKAESWAEDGRCKINRHYAPQICFCGLRETLAAYHVIPFHNMSAEAEILASRLPEPSAIGSGVEAFGTPPIVWGVHGTGSMEQGGRGTGVNEARREEIRAFLTTRFAHPADEDVKVTNAANHMKKYISDRVMEVIHKMYEEDYRTLWRYFS